MFSCPPLIQAEIEMCEFSPCSGDLDFRCFPTFCSNLERSPRVPIWGTLEPLIEPLKSNSSEYELQRLQKSSRQPIQPKNLVCDELTMDPGPGARPVRNYLVL